MPGLLAAMMLALAFWNAEAGEFSGFVAVDARLFPESPTFPRQDKRALQPSLVLQPEYRRDFSDGADRVTVIPFARLDAIDYKRTHFDVRELSWLRVFDGWDVLAGVSKVFWGVTESRHLVDIVNQTDLVEHPDGEDKLGQPMIRLAAFQDWGTLTLFGLPYFRGRTFPGRAGRLRFALPVDTDRPVYQSSLKNWHPDAAIRWSHVLGNWDIGLAHFRGTSREPRLVPALDRVGRAVLVPHYDLINQTSLDLQLTGERLIWKLETIGRWGHGAPFGAVVAGFEYTFSGVFGTALDLGALGEYLFDGRGANAPPMPFDDDLFFGTRLTFNDPQSTELLAGAIIDRRSQATILSVEASRRLGDRWSIKLDVRAFANVPPSDILFAFRRDHFVQLQLAYFF